MLMQAVKSIAYTGASRYTGYIAKTIQLTLVCGHQQYRKASAGVPARANCRECERAREPIVLRTAREIENERRQRKGLPPVKRDGSHGE